MENSGRRVMYRKVTPRPMSASANLYDRFACARKTASGRTATEAGSGYPSPRQDSVSTSGFTLRSSPSAVSTSANNPEIALTSNSYG
jgi:hypothetical protein